MASCNAVSATVLLTPRVFDSRRCFRLCRSAQAFFHYWCLFSSPGSTRTTNSWFAKLCFQDPSHSGVVFKPNASLLQASVNAAIRLHKERPPSAHARTPKANERTTSAELVFPHAEELSAGEPSPREITAPTTTKSRRLSIALRRNSTEAERIFSAGTIFSLFPCIL